MSRENGLGNSPKRPRKYSSINICKDEIILQVEIISQSSAPVHGKFFKGPAHAAHTVPALGC